MSMRTPKLLLILLIITIVLISLCCFTFKILDVKSRSKLNALRKQTAVELVSRSTEQDVSQREIIELFGNPDRKYESQDPFLRKSFWYIGTFKPSGIFPEPEVLVVEYNEDDSIKKISITTEKD